MRCGLKATAGWRRESPAGRRADSFSTRTGLQSSHGLGKVRVRGPVQVRRGGVAALRTAAGGLNGSGGNPSAQAALCQGQGLQLPVHAMALPVAHGPLRPMAASFLWLPPSLVIALPPSSCSCLPPALPRRWRSISGPGNRAVQTALRSRTCLKTSWPVFRHWRRSRSGSPASSSMA